MYRYILEPYKGRTTRHKCPQCNKPFQFARYIDTETGECLPDDIGRCNRESACGYHFTPKQYYQQAGGKYIPIRRRIEEVIKPQKIDFIPSEYIEKTMQGFNKTNFAEWLTSLFSSTIAENALLQYYVGRSSINNGKASIFWRIDKEQRVRTGKIVCYDSETGKRKKGEYDPAPFFVHAMKKDKINAVSNEIQRVNILPPGNYQQCFFGEHLLKQYPLKSVGIVESEKTALIASICMPQMVWLATGGASGCKWREYSIFKVLENKRIVLFPDFGYFNKTTLKTCFIEWEERANTIADRIVCKIKVSRILEDNIQEEQRVNDFDLVDYLIKRENGKGWALTSEGYPMFWDI